ncbi:hypothetical protein N9Y17_02465, partial [Gammaproteobacteria bacterium]|nr:hypothetical protein [Gammaproteobacteria bacterium]
KQLNNMMLRWYHMLAFGVLALSLVQCQMSSPNQQPSLEQKVAAVPVKPKLGAKTVGFPLSEKTERKLIWLLESTQDHRVVTWKDQQSIYTFRVEKSTVESGHQCRYYQLSIVNDQEVHVYPAKACHQQPKNWQLSE